MDVNSNKEVVVFSIGDPRQIKTWSNIPYFLVTTLEAKGIIVHTVDLSVKDAFQEFIRKVYNFILFRIFKSKFLNYFYSPLYCFIVNLKIRRAIKKYSKASMFIFTTFSFSASKFSSKPSILLCDWTIEHYLGYFLNKKPNYFERSAIRRENKIIENAKAVFVLFPSIAATLKKKLSNPNIFYNGNVVNSIIKSNPDVIRYKSKRDNLLFIGNKKYLKGATELISTFLLLKKTHPDLKLHIIGLHKSDVPASSEDIYFYGYLDKSKEQDVSKYYDLLRNATIFINTTPKWASFSASLEAMYFYTPVIVTAYTEFVHTFGNEINFGKYYNPDKDTLADTIEGLLADENYEQICNHAYEAANEHSWDSYVDRFMNKINSVTQSQGKVAAQEV